MSKAYVDDHRIMLDDKDITNFCKDVTLTDDLQALAVELTFTVFISEWDNYVKKLGIEPGAKVKVVNHDTTVFSGLVVSVSLDGAVTAYDRGWYLNKSQIIFQCTNLAADAAIRQMCVKGGVDAGEIAPLETLISETWISETPTDILSEILETCSNATGKKYRFRINPESEKLDITELTKEPIEAWHKPADNLAAFRITWALGQVSGSDSIDNLCNAVTIAAEDDGKIYIGAYGSNPASIQKYGMIQRVETVSKDPGDAALRQQVQTILEDCDRITATRSISEIWGTDEALSGVILKFNSPAFGIAGLYRVMQVVHHYGGAGHTMELEIEAVEQPRAVVGTEDTIQTPGLPDDLGLNKSEKPTDTEETEGKQIVNAIFTAYFPSNTGDNGGFKDAMGGRLNPSHNTCAVPLEVPLGSKITVLHTNTSLDGKKFKANDHGDAIVIDSDGVYHIDILMSSAAECDEWGVKPGMAIIEDGTEKKKFTETTTDKTGAEAFLDVARGEIGYHAGANYNNKYGAYFGENHQAWCVFFVSWCAEKSDAPIPKYGYVGDMSDHFKALGKYHSVSSGYLPQPGDLMIHLDKHIGIVEKATRQNVITIEGNHSNQVARVVRYYDGYITGFCSPWEE